MVLRGLFGVKPKEPLGLKLESVRRCRSRYARASQRAIMEALETKQFLSVTLYDSTINDFASFGTNVHWGGSFARTEIPTSDPESSRYNSHNATGNYFMGVLPGAGGGSDLEIQRLTDHYAIQVSFDLYIIGDASPSIIPFTNSVGTSFVAVSGVGGPKFTLSAGGDTTEFDAIWNGDRATPWGPEMDGNDPVLDNWLLPDPAKKSLNPTYADDTPDPGVTIPSSLGTANSAGAIYTFAPSSMYANSAGVSSHRNVLGYDIYGRDVDDPDYDQQPNSSADWPQFCNGGMDDAVYHVTFEFDHKDSNLDLNFGVSGGYFGIDNITVKMFSAAVCSTCEGGTAAPSAPTAGSGSAKYSQFDDIGPGERITNSGWWTGGARLWQTPEKKSVAAYDMNSHLHWFDKSGDSYSPVTKDDQEYKLKDDGDGHLVLTDPDGNATIFYDFDSGNVSGKFLEFVSADSVAGAHSNPTASYDSSGKLLSIDSKFEGDTIVESTSFTQSGGMITGINHSKTVDGGAPVNIESVAFTPYSSGTEGGSSGDLKFATYSRNGTTVDTYYYRYFTSDTAGDGTNGTPGQIKMAFGPSAWTALVAKYGTGSIDSTADSDVSMYADESYEFQTYLSKDSTTPDKAKTFVEMNPNDDTYEDGFNNWKYKVTTSNTASGSTVVSIVYQNYLHQDLLDVVKDGSTIKSVTYTQYGNATTSAADSVVLIAHASAFVAGPDGKYYNEGANDLGLAGTASSYLSPNKGLFEFMEYGDSGTINGGTVGATGDVHGRLSRSWVGQGRLSLINHTAVLQESISYIKVANETTDPATNEIFQTYRDTVYSDANTSTSSPSGGKTTTYAYTYSGMRMETMAVSQTVSSSNNGPGTITTTTAYDAFGHPEYVIDADGYTTYTSYDPVTGALIEKVDDYGGLNLTTKYAVDNLGRVTKVVDPNHASTDTPTIFYVYDDAHHAVYTIQGASWSGTSMTSLVPIQMSHREVPYTYSIGSTVGATYDETLTFSGTLTVSTGFSFTSGSVTLPSFISSGNINLLDLATNNFTIQSLSRTIYDDIGRTVESDDYFSIINGTSNAYLQTSSSSAQGGTAGTNYYQTFFGYDVDGRQDSVTNPTGTINETDYDALGRVSDEKTGTTTHSPQVAVENQYDYGGLGDGNLTLSIQYPGASATPRGTAYLYDWRDRLVSTKSGLNTTFPTDLGWSGSSASFSGTTLLVSSNGTGLNALGDNIDFVAKSITGDTYLSTIVGQSSVVGANSALGVMIRASTTDTTAKFAAMMITPAGVVFAYRDSSLVVGTPLAVPNVIGVKIVRSGFSYAGYYTTNGSSWTLFDAISIVGISSGAYAGISIWSGDASGFASARLDSVVLGGTALTRTESSTLNLPLTVSTLDNLGEVTSLETYDGDGRYMVDADGDGVPDGLDSSTLRAKVDTAYDELGRAFRTTTYSVSPSTGTYSTTTSLAIITDTWFDKRGNTIAQHTSGSPMTKMIYDGADRLTTSFTTDGAAKNSTDSSHAILSSWSDANTVGGDVVLSQIEYTYDANSNLTLTTTRDRFHNDSDSSTGALGTASSGVNARVSYIANYYDSANRVIATSNVGTNGGSSYTRPSTGPTASTDTLLANLYHYDNSGQLDLVTDSMERITKTVYDALGRKTQTISNYRSDINSGQPSTSNTAANLTTLYTYDGSNHILTLTAKMPTGSHDQVTQYVYRAADAVTAASGQSITLSPTVYSNDMLWLVKYPDKSLGSAGTSSSYWNLMNYNALGEMLTRQDQNGSVHTYSYDTVGRLTQDSASTKPTTTVTAQSQTVRNSVFTLSSGSNVQTVDLVAGTYKVHFAANSTSTSSHSFTVSVDGTSLGSFTIPGSSSTVLNYISSSITVSTGTHTLTISGSTSGDGAFSLSNIAMSVSTSSVSDSGFDSVDTSSSCSDCSGDYFQPSSSAWTFDDGTGVNTSMGGTVAFSDHADPACGFNVSQGVFFAKGTYVLTFRQYNTSSTGTLNVSVGTTSIGATVGGNHSWRTIVTGMFTISTAGTYTLKFAAASGYFIYFDDVTVRSVAPTVSVGTLVADQSVVTTYNSQGLVDTITTYDAASSGNVLNQIKRDYNGFGQMTKEWQQHGNTVNTTTTGTMSLAVSYAYTADASPSDVSKYGSRLTSVTYPSGRVLTYSYGSSNSLNDLIGRLDALTENSGSLILESYKYLGLSTVVERDHPEDGVNQTYISQGTGDHSSDSGTSDPYTGLDRFGRVVDERWTTTGGSSDKDRYQYTYDRNDNRTSSTNTLHSAFSETYTYDGLNRLISTDRSGGTSDDQSWTLDALGNMKGVTTSGTTESRSFNDENQLTVQGSATWITYDSNGNLTIDAGHNTYVYDAWNRLVAVKNSFGYLVKGYGYDGLGRRIVETDGIAASDLYYSDGWQVLEERKGVSTALGASNSSNGYAVAQYIYSPVYVNAPILRDRDSDNDSSHTLDERIYMTQDANFNVTALLNTSGAVQQRQVYRAGGAFLVTDGSFGSKLGDSFALRQTFQGGWQDLSTGLINFQRRDYNPNTQTWNSEDPLGFVDGMSLYQFELANPLNSLDSKGTESEKGPPKMIWQEEWSELLKSHENYFELSKFGQKVGKLAGKMLEYKEKLKEAKENLDDISEQIELLQELMKAMKGDEEARQKLIDGELDFLFDKAVDAAIPSPFMAAAVKKTVKVSWALGSQIGTFFANTARKGVLYNATQDAKATVDKDGIPDNSIFVAHTSSGEFPAMLKDKKIYIYMVGESEGAWDDAKILAKLKDDGKHWFHCDQLTDS